jgi:hypothetical protein
MWLNSFNGIKKGYNFDVANWKKIWCDLCGSSMEIL